MADPAIVMSAARPMPTHDALRGWMKFAGSWRRKHRPATCVASPSDPKETPRPKAPPWKEFHIGREVMSNGDLPFR
jgi:hypothetical protein